MKFVILGVLFAVIFASSINAAYTLSEGRLMNVDDVATLTAEGHFSAGAEAMEKRNWKEAARQFRIVTLHFPSSREGQDAFYFLGIAYFYLKEYEWSNDAFTSYLQGQHNAKYFQSALEYKYAIADKFQNGARRRLFAQRSMPKLVSGDSLVIPIYDEIVAAMPTHDLAARSLYSKGCLLCQQRLYRESVEAFQQVVQRFPKHELAPRSYLAICTVYFTQSKYEPQNPDLIALAQLNLYSFAQDFPAEERLTKAEGYLLLIKERHATSLYDMGQFYERTGNPGAAVLYYTKAAKQFPETTISNSCRSRLQQLKG